METPGLEIIIFLKRHCGGLGKKMAGLERLGEGLERVWKGFGKGDGVPGQPGMRYWITL